MVMQSFSSVSPLLCKLECESSSLVILHQGWFSDRELIRVVLGVLEVVATSHHPVLGPGGEGQEQGHQAGHHSPAPEGGLGVGVVAVGALVLRGASKLQGRSSWGCHLKLHGHGW